MTFTFRSLGKKFNQSIWCFLTLYVLILFSLTFVLSGGLELVSSSSFFPWFSPQESYHHVTYQSYGNYNFKFQTFRWPQAAAAQRSTESAFELDIWDGIFHSTICHIPAIYLKYSSSCFSSLFRFLIMAVGSRRDTRVAGVWQVCGSWPFQCGNVSGLSVREGGRCVAVGRFSVAVVPHLCVSQCGRCVVSAWQLSVSRQVCLTFGLMKIMVEKPPNYSCLSILKTSATAFCGTIGKFYW